MDVPKPGNGNILDTCTMLFRNFTLLVIFVGVCGVMVVNIMESRRQYQREFAVEQRLEGWRSFYADQVCKQGSDKCKDEISANSI